MARPKRGEKSEWVLLGLCSIFLCVLLLLSARDKAILASDAIVVETEHEVSLEELIPPPPVPIDLNLATEEELCALPGIGEELSRRILRYRLEQGPFESVEELTEVPGIGEGKLAALEGYLKVE